MIHKKNAWIMGIIVIAAAVVIGGIVFFQNKIVGTNLSGSLKKECPPNWSWYESENISFCYNNSWGTLKLTDQTNEQGRGTQFKIGFANERYTDVDNAPSTPQLWWKTSDYAPEATDYETVCFKCINFSQSESDIISALGYANKNATVQKVSVNGKNALRVKTDYFESSFDQGQINRLEYFVPNAFDNYHFQAIVSFSQADELDLLIKSLSFKE